MEGLKQSHQVGLWKEMSGLPRDELFSGLTNMSLLASVTVTSGSASGMFGPDYRGSILTDFLTLQPGGYEIAGTFRPGAEDIIKAADVGGQPPLRTILGVEIGAPTFYFGEDFRPPESGAQRYGVFVGPMLTVIIPEPSPAAYLLPALVVVAWTHGVRASGTRKQ